MLKDNGSFSNLILFGSGFYNMEQAPPNPPFMWSTDQFRLYFLYKFDKVVLNVHCSGHNQTNLKIIKKSGEIVAPLVIGDNTLEIDLDDNEYLDFSCNVFCPKEIIETSTDTRKLGIILNGISVFYGNQPYSIELKDIKTKKYFELKNQCKLSSILKSQNHINAKRFNTFFDKVFCISTVPDAERRIHALSQYKKYNINFEFVPAFPTDISDKFGTSELTKEEVSLCLTAKHCLELAKMNGYPAIVLMEDDFEFSEDWLNDFINFQQNLPTDWDLLYMGQADWWESISDKKVKLVNDYVERVFFANGAHFIAIRDSVYDLCISLLGSLGDRLDGCFNHIMKDSDYKCYSSRVNLATSISSPPKEFTDRIPDFTITDYLPSRLNLK